ncbi:hypothetical protein D3C81_1804460 [compost metagenome]
MLMIGELFLGIADQNLHSLLKLQSVDKNREILLLNMQIPRSAHLYGNKGKKAAWHNELGQKVR